MLYGFCLAGLLAFCLLLSRKIIYVWFLKWLGLVFACFWQYMCVEIKPCLIPPPSLLEISLGIVFSPMLAFCKNSKRGNWSRKSLGAELFHLCSFLDKVFQKWLAISSFPGLDGVVVKVLPLKDWGSNPGCFLPYQQRPLNASPTHLKMWEWAKIGESCWINKI